ncbi:polysaccharide deacetylase family protein [Porphyromonadaceae bacterium W3.11]|nr:polysaccharide deacetylase family protein [Porphyromonadaceae bacterium W3.11]
MFIERPPLLYRILFPNATWRIPAPADESKVVYLTFDDGPIPEVTPWVLEQLRIRDIRATFFCVGENVWRHPDIFEQILEEGHGVGNHTYHHLQGIKTNTADYLQDVYKANKLIKSRLMRPPHGHIGWCQLRGLMNQYQVIMWDLVTRDYSKKQSPQKVLENVKRYARNGSIIVFHDSLKAEKNLRYALPLALDHLMEDGYEFRLLPGARHLESNIFDQELEEAI